MFVVASMSKQLILGTAPSKPPPPASISPTVLFTGSGDKRDFFGVFLSSLGQYPFNAYKEEKKNFNKK